jgi:hypothetical protein
MERAHFGGWLAATCDPLPADFGWWVVRVTVQQPSPDGIPGARSTVVAMAWVAEGAAADGLIIRLIVQTIRWGRSGAVQIDEACNLGRPGRSGAVQIDLEHQVRSWCLAIRCWLRVVGTGFLGVAVAWTGATAILLA